MAVAVPYSVICKVTGIEHLVVDGEQNRAELITYLTELKRRLGTGTVNIALDCEGWVLGVIKKSLGMI